MPPLDPGDRLPLRSGRSLEPENRDVRPALREGELRASPREEDDACAQRVCVRTGFGCETPVAERRTLERLDSREDPRQGARSEQHRDRVGVAVHVEPAEQRRDSHAGRRQRAFDDLSLGTRSVAGHLQRLASPLEPVGGCPGARE